ncbi:UvrD-helicase domain-containing protein [Allohahella sp. A8]|uniref:UvrD-helicase domain-containing protein n=1 Tax=Allohahella sp. A8 TaxID=3141461 RepID=UPI000C0AB668|nr:ATP-dependent DNA helicase Rep [Hahellaceae bacterium]|tara:strand:- start:16178 stop:18262 length:2085 start_codon:yes stop_codon:yes gene_type:complete
MFTGLNPQQKAAVRYCDGPVLVLAGAGSGKTSVITRKIGYLIGECGIQARHIAAVTFTNKAAREMRERVQKLIPASASRGLQISTFHNLGLTILRKEAQYLGRTPALSIFDDQDSKTLLKDLTHRDFGLETEALKRLQGLISDWKNRLITPERALAEAIAMQSRSDGPPDQLLLIAARAFELYEQHLAAYNAVDFDDLITGPVRLFQQHPERLQHWRSRIHYLLVDEYQDTNDSQYELVRQLVGARQALTVVGDDDQSIYSWRGAKPQNLVRLQDDFPTLKLIKLEQNYRSSSRILKAANAVIANNPHVFEKTLWSELGVGDEIRIVKTLNEEAEVGLVAMEIIDRRLQSRSTYGDFAVLYRSNHQSRLLELKLQSLQIPYRMSGGTSFFSRSEVKDAMAYLRVLTNPRDDGALLRIINTPKREIGASSVQRLRDYAARHSCSLLEAAEVLADPEQAARSAGDDAQLPARAAASLQSFLHQLHSVRRGTSDGGESDAGKQLKDWFIALDFPQWLQQTSSSASQAERRFDNMNALCQQIQRMLDADPELDINGSVSKLVLQDILDGQEEDGAEEDAVNLLTLHAAKGLEFPHVYILGLEEEILPHRNSTEPEQIEEERRLFYVGITRAKQTLTMTYAGVRKQYGEKLTTTISRFAEELPQEDVIYEGLTRPSKEASRARGRATLDALFKDLADDL